MGAAPASTRVGFLLNSLYTQVLPHIHDIVLVRLKHVNNIALMSDTVFLQHDSTFTYGSDAVTG